MLARGNPLFRRTFQKNNGSVTTVQKQQRPRAMSPRPAKTIRPPSATAYADGTGRGSPGRVLGRNAPAEHEIRRITGAEVDARELLPAVLGVEVTGLP